MELTEQSGDIAATLRWLADTLEIDPPAWQRAGQGGRRAACAGDRIRFSLGKGPGMALEFDCLILEPRPVVGAGAEPRYLIETRPRSRRRRVTAASNAATTAATHLFLAVDRAAGIVISPDASLRSSSDLPSKLWYSHGRIRDALREGWATWEREWPGSDVGPVEILLGATRRFLPHLLMIESAVAGLDSGHREMIAEKVFRGQRVSW